MASNISRPLARSIKTHSRAFSTAPLAQSESGLVDREPKASLKKLSNGVIVGTVENQSPVARLAVVAHAGSRFETGKNLGISHLLRHALNRRTENYTGFAMCRTAQQLGGDLTVESTRENLYIRSSVTRNCAGKIVEILREMCTKQYFRPWEIADIQGDEDLMALDLAVLKTQPNVHALELLHAAAFREGGLGNSLYAPQHMIGKYNADMLDDYVQSTFGAGRLALVGVGMDSAELEALGSEFLPYQSSAPAISAPAKYHGGEVRQNSGGDISYVAVAMAGPSNGSQDLLASEVLKCALGLGPHIKYSGGASLLSKAGAAASDVPQFVSGLSANYSDAGLFGFTAISHNSGVEQVVSAVASEFQSVLTNGLSDADVAKAKTLLKASICMDLENADKLLTWQAEQALSSDQVLVPKDVCAMIDSVSTQDVNKVAKTIAASKPSMAVTGNTSGVPYLDQILK